MRKTKFFGLLLTFFLLIGISVGVSAAFGDVNVTVTYNVDLVDGEPTTIPTAHGSMFTHKAPAERGPGKTFKYWVVNGIVRQDLNKDINIITRSSLNLKAVYGQDNKYIVTFIDSNGAYLKHEFVDEGVTATAPTAPSKPQAVFSGFVGLGTTANVSDPITMDTVFVATYTTSTEAGKLTVGGIVKPVVKINDLVTLEAPANFSHWVDGEGNILSYDPNYKFTMLVANRIVNPVEGTPEVKPLVNMIAEPNLRTGYTSYVGQFEMPEGYELVEYGFIISRSLDALTVDSLGATVIPSNVYNNETNEFLRSFELDTYNSIRAYAVFNDGTKQVYEYSDKMIGATTEEQIIYETGFETPDFTAATEYNKPEKAVGPAGTQWAVRYGTPSSTSAISGAQSLQMRWYIAAPTTPIYAYTAFQSTNATKITFSSANHGLGGNVEVTISVDGGLTWIAPEVFTLSTTSTEFTYNVPEAYQTGSVQFKFTYVVSDPIPKDTDRLYIDDVKIYGGSQSTAKHEIVTIIDGVSTTSFVSEGSSIPNPTKDGYTFVGWYLEDTFVNQFNGPVSQSRTLYAKFTINNYTLSFNTDGGSPLESINQPFGSTIFAPEDPLKEGYIFNGWSPALPETMPAGNQTFTAVWDVIQYTVTFETNGGDPVTEITRDFGTEVTLPMPTRTDFIFNGWYSDITLETLVESLIMPLNGITLYADWVHASSTSIVTFETNGGSSIHPVTVINGQAVAKPADPTKTGYNFDGWYSDSALTTLYNFDSNVESNITLYAKWDEVVASLLYSYNFIDGGSSSNFAYANTNLSTNVSYASDNPGGISGTTTWIASYANLSMTTETRLGGKLDSTEYGSPSANIRTDFEYTQSLTKVEILGASTFGTAGNVGNIYLQTSTDGITWSTISTKTVTSTIVFDGLSTVQGSYIKIVVQLKASTKNSGLAFTGIKVYGFPNQ